MVEVKTAVSQLFDSSFTRFSASTVAPPNETGTYSTLTTSILRRSLTVPGADCSSSIRLKSRSATEAIEYRLKK